MFLSGSRQSDLEFLPSRSVLDSSSKAGRNMGPVQEILAERTDSGGNGNQNPGFPNLYSVLGSLLSLEELSDNSKLALDSG